jgi:hypothetical protein
LASVLATLDAYDVSPVVPADYNPEVELDPLHLLAAKVVKMRVGCTKMTKHKSMFFNDGFARKSVPPRLVIETDGEFSVAKTALYLITIVSIIHSS